MPIQNQLGLLPKTVSKKGRKERREGGRKEGKRNGERERERRRGEEKWVGPQHSLDYTFGFISGFLSFVDNGVCGIWDIRKEG